MRPYLTAFALCVAPVCARGAEPPEYRVRGDLAIRARETLRKYCSECHTGGADPGRSKLKLLDHAQVVGKKKPVPLADPGGRALLLDLIKDGSMPPANRPGPTPEEVADLEKWVAAKAPAYPAAFDDTAVLNAIADDLERDRDNPDRPLSPQYVSFAHLVRDGHPPPALGAAEQRLRVALALGSPTGDPAPLVPVDDAGTVFRFDVERQGWWGGHVFERIEGRKAVRNEEPTRLEVLLDHENPHARTFPPGDPGADRLREYLLLRGLQTPFLRGDWIADALAGGWAPRAVLGRNPRTPLAQDIVSLAALRRPMAPAVPPDGPVAKPFGGGLAVVVPAPRDGRKPVPPLSAWYAGDVTPEKPPFALKAELVAGAQNVTKVKVDEPFVLRVSCDKKAFFTLLMVHADGEVRVQQVQGGNVLVPGRERLLSPNGASFVISGISTGGDAALEHFVLFVSETELPHPVIVRSKHADKHVWRFLMEPTEKYPFDPNAVVRKVIPVRVTRK